jgi:hypothetical protein
MRLIKNEEKNPGRYGWDVDDDDLKAWSESMCGYFWEMKWLSFGYQ